ncbi:MULTISPECIES: AraC family transcriptional regulator [unclassified Exiguobacterium]|uniref:helix-turn-helix transcriptional regulator n=1 Tax=unclassified Exiguobacterium TaxID=2644629 RepID=UPI002036A8E0|nr:MULTISPECIES: AraC family transcriptional regulator [unclassified Exiguobacterium]
MRLTRHGDSTFSITDQFTILWIESGVVDLVVNGEWIKLDSNEGLMLTDGQSYVIQRMKESSQIVKLQFDPYELFHPNMAERYVKSYDTLDKSIHILKKERTPRSLVQTIERAIQYIESEGPLAMMDATLQCTVIWRYWIQQECLSTKHSKKLESLRNMLSCVHSQLEDKLSLAQIATAGKVSRSECCRLFKRFGDTTPLAYVQLKRMDRAATLLEDSTESIADIAQRLSYSSVSHFVQTFKAHHSITPLAYRKKYQTKRAE